MSGTFTIDKRNRKYHPQFAASLRRVPTEDASLVENTFNRDENVSAEVVDQHQIPVLRAFLFVQDRARGSLRTRRHRQDVTGTRLCNVSNVSDLVGCEAEELKGKAVLSGTRHEVDPFGGNREVGIEDGRKHGDFFPAVHRDFDQRTLIPSVEAVKILTVRRLHVENRTASCYLHCLSVTAVRWHLPQLGLARAIRLEIDPASVSREAAAN